MSWSYSGDPSASDLDWIRFQIGDTDATAQVFSDEEILGILSDQGNKNDAAAFLLRRRAQDLAATPNFRIGRFSEDFGTAAARLEEKADALAAANAAKHVGLFAGGISESDRAAREADADRTSPAFTKDMHDFPEAAESEAGE